MDEKTPSLTVSFIDREHRAAYMEYDGCPITLAFSKQENSGIRESLKEILIGSVLKDTAKSHNCV